MRRTIYAMLAGIGIALLGAGSIPGIASAEEPSTTGTTTESPAVSGEESATTWDKTREVSAETWDATREGSAKAWDKTREVSADAWDATKEGSAKAWDKTREVSADAWDATKEGSAKAWDKTREISGDAWDATKEGSAKAWDGTKDMVQGEQQVDSETEPDTGEASPATIDSPTPSDDQPGAATGTEATP